MGGERGEKGKGRGGEARGWEGREGEWLFYSAAEYFDVEPSVLFSCRSPDSVIQW